MKLSHYQHGLKYESCLFMYSEGIALNNNILDYIPYRKKYLLDLESPTFAIVKIYTAYYDVLTDR